MQKTKSFVLLILFLLFVSLLFLSKSLQKQTKAPASTNDNNKVETSLLPSQSVINFYSKYLLYTGNLLSEDAYGKSGYLTDDFKNKLKTEISKKPDVNPVICASEKPEEIKIHSATLSGSLAVVLVTQTSQSISSNHLVKLKLVGKEYKIYDIICN